MEDLVTLPERWSKTANIVLNKMFDVVDGIAVDARVPRISKRTPEFRLPAPLAAEKVCSLLPTNSGKTSTKSGFTLGEKPALGLSASVVHMSDICPSYEQPNPLVQGISAGPGTLAQH